MPVSTIANGREYARYHNHLIRLIASTADHPDPALLEWHAQEGSGGEGRVVRLSTAFLRGGGSHRRWMLALTTKGALT